MPVAPGAGGRNGLAPWVPPGKKNWLFVGAAEAGQRSAILYTIVECCRRRGLDPYAYLRHVLTRLPFATNWQIAELTPEAWAKQTQSLKRAA